MAIASQSSRPDRRLWVVGQTRAVIVEERFEGTDPHPAVWTASYLPARSSRTAAVATYRVGGGELRLSIPPEQGLWCPDRHEPPLRVSAVQSGNWSGPVGSTRGQAPSRRG